METTPPRLFDLRQSTFKSYYVVWKLAIAPAIIMFLFMFKSYYVVWKPVAVPAKFSDLVSLNRTM